MFKKSLIFLAGILLGAYATMTTMTIKLLTKRNKALTEKLADLKASNTEKES